MRQVWKAAIVLAALAPLAPVAPVAQAGRGTNGITVFEDANFQGRSVTTVNDVPDLRSLGMDDRVSSLAVAGSEVWEICEDRNYRGRCLEVSGTETDLRRRGLHDEVSSLRRVNRGSSGSTGSSIQLPVVQQLELFAGTNYSGQRLALTAATPDLRRVGFNDRAMSVRVGRGSVWEICVNPNYDDCRVIDRDYADLSLLGLTRLMTSARPRASGSGAVGGWRPPGGRTQIILFDETNYRGRSMTIDSATPALGLFANRTASVQVLSGRWELCDQTQFNGRCITVNGNVRDLGTVGFRDRLSSLRPR